MLKPVRGVAFPGCAPSWNSEEAVLMISRLLLSMVVAPKLNARNPARRMKSAGITKWISRCCDMTRPLFVAKVQFPIFIKVFALLSFFLNLIVYSHMLK